MTIPRINIAKTSIQRLFLLFVMLVTVFASIGSGLMPHTASAANLANFNAGHIIDDSVFFDSTALSVNDIQNFLNSHIGWNTTSHAQTTSTCDTQGSQIYSGTQTRAQYSATQGYSAPFTCLKDYSTSTNSEPSDAYCSGYSPSTQTAAQIIYGVAQSCGINPEVLLVLLQKEQGLVTDTWPWSSQYTKATSYACPDTSGCDATYYGFFNQVYYAARQFKHYKATPSSFSYTAFRNNTILYNPSVSCGSSTVYIQNQATAALYNYTPYQPNAAALSAGYGTGNSCSSYGIRNFWLYFTDWFGSTTQVLPSCNASASNTSCVWRLVSPDGSEFLTNSVDERNTLVSNGYNYEGLAFYAHSSNVPNSVPVYRVILANGDHQWTASLSERNALVSAGATYEGVAWYADSADANTDYPVYRLVNSTNTILTGSVVESNELVQQGYTLNGPIFSSPSPVVEVWAPPSGQTIVFRMFNKVTSQHFWTASVSERDSLLTSGNYTYEGGSMNGQTSTTGTPVYRLMNKTNGQHFWTASSAERDSLAAGNYTYEGVAWYEPTTGTPVYRLMNKTNGQHFWTASSAERDSLAAGNYTYEGVAWSSY